MSKITIVLTIPEPLHSKLNSEIKMLHKKYGKDCKSNRPNDHVYYDIPHITLFSMGDCSNNKKEIKKTLKEIVKNHNPIKIKSKELTLFKFEDLCHLVIKIEKNKELQELHNEIINKLLPYSEKKGKFVLKLYTPHCSKILYIPKELGEKIKNEANIKEFEFTAKEVGIKVKQDSYYNLMEEKLKLNELSNKL